VLYTSGEKFKETVNLLGKSLGKEGAYNTPKPYQGGFNMENHLYSLYQMVLKSLIFYLGIDQEKKRAGRPPKVSDLQLCALFILSYITNTPVFTLAKSLIDLNIKSYHLFRKTRIQRVYRLLKEYRNRRILSILFAKLLLGKKVKLIVDGTILEVANLNRARTQRIKRFSGKAFWGKKKRNLYSEHYREKGKV
jgi:hypothetical protein